MVWWTRWLGVAVTLFFFFGGVLAETRNRSAPPQDDIIADRTLLQVWGCADNFRQLWNVEKVDGGVNLILQYNNKCIDIQGFLNNTDTIVWLWECHPDTIPYNQKWTITSTGQIQSVMNGMCLAQSHSQTGAPVWIVPCTNNDSSQQWTINPGGLITNKGSGECLDAGSSFTCEEPSLSFQPWCNTSLSMDQRVDALVGQLDTFDMYLQLGASAPAIGVLGVIQYNWGTECLHGVNTDCGPGIPCATSFPAPSALGATFNMHLVHAIAQAISDEARAYNNQNWGPGLTYWAPNININRDPRWGRNQEVPGEDPYLTSQYVMNFVRGLQEGNDFRYAKVVSTCKHYAAYSLENWHGVDRFHFNAVVDDFDLVDTYLPAWKACVVDARARSVMCSYNAVNGVPSCANDFLLQKILRSTFGFDGYVVSDCGAIGDIFLSHNYTKSAPDACAVALHAGCDLNCGSFYQAYLPQAINDSSVTDADLRKSVRRLFKQRFDLGMFDPVGEQIYTKIPASVIDSADHSRLALQSARESMVLLKNQGGILPLAKDLTVAVIGPNADVRETLLSNYHGMRCQDGSYNCVQSPLEAVQQMIGSSNVIYAQGCDVNTNDTSGFQAAIKALQNADVGVIFLGINQTIEAEGQDRTETTLPGVQMSLVQNLTQVGTPIVVVLINGGTVSIEWIKDNVPAILEAWYPGENGARAIAEVLFGDYNPGGRLPVTVYPADYVNKVSMFDMSMRPSSSSPGRSYRWYTGTPLWPFGHGLSYTQFRQTWASDTSDLVMHTGAEASGVSFRVNVTNVGTREGDEVVLAFVTAPNNQNQMPFKQLFGFQRVHLVPGETRQLFFSTPPDAFAVATGKGFNRIIRAGHYNLEVGVGENAISAPLRIVGDDVILVL